MNKSKRYYSMLNAAEREVSVEALATLVARLEKTALDMRVLSEAESVAVMDALAARLAAELREHTAVQKCVCPTCGKEHRA